MSGIATPTCHRAASPPGRRHPPPHPRQTRRSRRRDHKRRRRQTRRARTARRELRHPHQQLPKPAHSLFDALAGASTRPTSLRCLVSALATLLTSGRRTARNPLRTPGARAPGHPPSHHHVSSQRHRSSWRWARGLAGWAFDHLVPEDRVLRAGGDAVDEHGGAKVFGKGCHRDPARSTRSCTTFRRGHERVVLTVPVRFPGTRRLWALPVLVAPYHSAKDNQKAGRRHKTPARLLGQLCCAPLRRFRRRRFVLGGDGNYGSHERARFASRRRGRPVPVSKSYPDAGPYEPAPPYSGHYRPRVKGDKLPTPEQVVAGATRTRRDVAWYGGGRREVGIVGGTGQWYKAGEGLVAVRRVYVHDLTGSQRDEYFFTTGVGLSAPEVIEAYLGRGDEGTSFQEMRSYLGSEPTRGWTEETVRRAAPCLFGAYTLVACWYSQWPKRYAGVRAVDRAGTQEVTFSDAITAVRRWPWVEWVLAIPGHREAVQERARPFRCLLLHALAPGA
jgi:hypothetical protein